MKREDFRTMANWVRLCGVNEAPAEGAVNEQRAGEFEVCLARAGGELRALDNLCPHRRGPLGQGWIEGNAVVCPWHSWAFDLNTGLADYPPGEKVGVFALRIEGEDLLIDVE
jgi:nitrite reductase (NADH) small subunit